jgi:hypothetical protein
MGMLAVDVGARGDVGGPGNASVSREETVRDEEGDAVAGAAKAAVGDRAWEGEGRRILFQRTQSPSGRILQNEIRHCI